jgi:hypothetical protein
MNSIRLPLLLKQASYSNALHNHLMPTDLRLFGIRNHGHHSIISLVAILSFR